MNSNRLVLMFMVFGVMLSVFMPVSQVKAAIDYTTIVSDPNALPFAFAYDGSTTVYVTDYNYKGFYSYNFNTKVVTAYIKTSANPPWGGTLSGYGIAYASSKIFVTGREGNVGVYVLPSGPSSVITTGPNEGILYHNSYIWVASALEQTSTTGLIHQINPSTNAIIRSISIPYRPNFIYGNGNFIYITCVGDGRVLELSTTTFTVTRTFGGGVEKLYRPLGITGDGGTYLYVAENERASDYPLGVSAPSRVARIRLSDGVITQINTGTTNTDEGPYYVLYVSPNLYFTDNSRHVGIVGGTIETISYSASYFMSVVGSNIIVLSKGSVNLGTIPLPTPVDPCPPWMNSPLANRIRERLKVVIQTAIERYPRLFSNIPDCYGFNNPS